MKKKLLISIIPLFFAVFSYAQSAPSSVLSSQGGYAKNENYSLEWTLGEPVATTAISNFGIYTQGFNQSFIAVGRIVKRGGKELLRVFAAPNPVTSSLTVSIEAITGIRYSVAVTNLLGVRVYQRHPNFNTQQLNIDMRHLANGVYLLQVFDANANVISTSKIIKF